MHWLINIDEEILLTINGCHSTPMDWMMMQISGRWIWIPFYILFAILLCREKGMKSGLFYLLTIGVMILAVDQTCSSLLRPVIGRLRPSALENPISGMIHLVDGYRGGAYGFPSSHAANTMALAVFLAKTFKNGYLTLILLIWAFTVGLSRIYLGVHYPSDVTVGFLLGGLSALIFFRIAETLSRLEVRLSKSTI